MKNKYYTDLLAEERKIIMECLLETRNNLIIKGRYTDLVDELIIKISKAKLKTFRIK